MLIRSICPCCGEAGWRDVTVVAFEKTPFKDEVQAYYYIIENMEISNIILEDVFVKQLAPQLDKQLKNNAEKRSIRELLKNVFGVTESCCTPFIEHFDKIKTCLIIGMFAVLPYAINSF